MSKEVKTQMLELKNFIIKERSLISVSYEVLTQKRRLKLFQYRIKTIAWRSRTTLGTAYNVDIISLQLLKLSC